jgi:small subunit ribosomal protein S11
MLVKSKIVKRSNLIIIVNISCTSNNVIINISDIFNKTIYFGSGGLLGLKGSRRSTSYASQSIASVLGRKVYLLGARYAYVKIKGFGSSRYSSIKGLSMAGLKILNIIDLTPFPFNGCRSSKKRRI